MAGPCTDCIAGRFAPTYGAVTCDACRAGKHAANASTRCDSCAAGQSDEDSNPKSPCTPCANGTYAGCSETVCARWEDGSADADANQATPCTACQPGTVWVDADAEAGEAAVCSPCAAGWADTDGVSTTDCEECSIRTFAGLQSIECTVCADGSHDDDSNPATPCAALAGCLQQCEAGLDDDDCDEDTACVPCEAGKFSAGGARTAGTESICTDCAAGRVDHDSDTTTDCSDCPTGTFSLSVARAGSCDDCPTGRYAPTTGTDNNECQVCAAGQYAASGSSSCDSCAAGQSDEDSNPTSPSARLAPTARTQAAARQSVSDAKMDMKMPTRIRRRRARPASREQSGTTTLTTPHWERRRSVPRASKERPTPTVLARQTVNCVRRAHMHQYAPQSVLFARTDRLTTTVTPPQLVLRMCQQVCQQGYDDVDCSDNTPCVECAEGMYSDGGSWVIPGQTICVACGPGQYAPRGLNTSACESCPPGTADLDLLSWSACDECPVGTFTDGECRQQFCDCQRHPVP